MGWKKVCFDLKQGQDLAWGGDSHVKVTAKLVISLWGVNCRFWSHLGCLGWMESYYFCPFRYRKEIYKKMP